MPVSSDAKGLLTFFLGSLVGGVLVGSLLLIARDSPSALRNHHQSQQAVSADCSLLIDLPNGVYILSESDSNSSIIHNNNSGFSPLPETTTLPSVGTVLWHELNKNGTDKTFQFVKKVEQDDPNEVVDRLLLSWSDVENTGKRLENTGKKGLDWGKENVNKAGKGIKTGAKIVGNEVSKAGKDVFDAIDGDINQAVEIIGKLPGVVDDIANVPNEIRDSIKDVLGIETIADKLVNGVMDALEKISMLPGVSQLKGTLERQVSNLFARNMCADYQCAANAMGLDLNRIKLIENDGAGYLDTSLHPRTCIGVQKISFNSPMLTKFLGNFNVEKEVKKIYGEVKKFLEKEVKKITKYADDAVKLMENVNKEVDKARKALKDLIPVRRRQLVHVGNGQHVSREELAADLYEKGRKHLEELYGQHISRVFKERKLASRASEFISLDELKLKFTAGFEQEFTATTDMRFGDSGNAFEKTLYERTESVDLYRFLEIVGTASIATSMPYAVMMEGKTKSAFTYDAGEISVVLDVLKKKVSHSRRGFSTAIKVADKIGGSVGVTWVNEAHASLSLCFTPTKSCITLALDLEQKSGAGYDHMSGPDMKSGLELTPMFSHGAVKYKKAKKNDLKCDWNSKIAAGHWQHVSTPEVKISLKANAPCVALDEELYKLEAKNIAENVDSFCLSPGLSSANPKGLGFFGEPYFLVVYSSKVIGKYHSVEKAKQVLKRLGANRYYQGLVAEVKDFIKLQRNPHKINGVNQTPKNGFHKYWSNRNSIHHMMDTAQYYLDDKYVYKFPATTSTDLRSGICIQGPAGKDAHVSNSDGSVKYTKTEDFKNGIKMFGDLLVSASFGVSSAAHHCKHGTYFRPSKTKNVKKGSVVTVTIKNYSKYATRYNSIYGFGRQSLDGGWGSKLGNPVGSFKLNEGLPWDMKTVRVWKVRVLNEGRLVLFGPRQGTKSVRNWKEAKAFCEKRGGVLATRDQWCSATSSGKGAQAIFGGQKKGSQWVATGDYKNAMVQVGTGRYRMRVREWQATKFRYSYRDEIRSSACQTFHQLYRRTPSWIYKTDKKKYENNYLLCYLNAL